MYMTKTNTIITIGREFGSGGHEIGAHLAEKLEIPLYDKEMLDQMCIRDRAWFLPSFSSRSDI